MSTITLPNIRVSSDLTVGVVLKDGGVAIDWSTLSNIKAYLYADAQRAMAGRCSVAVDEEDSTRLVCSYRANKPQYIGVNRIVITCTYRGETKTFDKPALNFVRWTDDQAGQQITIDDPDVDVEIEVEDVSSSILEQAIAAALQAAADAEHAAHLIPNQVLLDCEQATAGANAAAEAANAAGITSVNVSVEDNEPGTPSAECSLANKVLSVIFHYLKGETGDAAGFGTISASFVEDGGDPSVLVTTSGPDTAKNIAFTLKNFKGDKGDKGDQGNTGSSVDYPFELVNNETTDDATKAHTAAGAKRLKDELSQLEHKVDGFPFDQEGMIKSDGTINSNASFSHTNLIEVKEGDVFYYKGRLGGTYICVAGYLANNFGSFVSSLLSSGTYSTYQKIVIPSGVNYIAASSANDTPSSLIIANGLVTSAKDDIALLLASVAGNTQTIRKKSSIALFYGGSPIAFDTTTKKATIPAGRIFNNSETIATTAQVLDLTVDFEGNSVAYGAIIVYDITTSAFKVVKNNYATENVEFLPIASYYGFGTSDSSNHYVNGAFSYTIDGDLYGINIPTFGGSQMAVVLNTSSVIPLQFDSVNKTLTIKGYSRFFMNNKYLLPSANTNDSTIDLTKDKDGNTVSHGLIVYRISNRDFKVYPNSQTAEDWNLAMVASYKFDTITSEIFINTPSYYSVDGNPYGIKVPTIEMPLYQPDYELIELPDTIAWWSDFIKVRVNGADELWLFKPSTGEEHESLSGYIYRISMADWSVIGSIKHDFGHCNTCHYLPDSDVLLIGNLPGNTAYPSALYIFYGVSSWVSESELRFGDIDKTIVDISALGMNNISAVFAESNGGKRNIVMVQDSVTTHKVAKLLLGMGSNQLAGGVFDSGVNDDKFNGTYQVLIQPIVYETYYTNSNEVVQGIDYHNGNVYSSNGHGTIRGFIWKNTRIGNVIREQILLPCYDGVGGVAYKTSEGILVDGEYTYQGAIPVTNETGTTKDASLPFAIIKYRTIK